MYTFEISIKLNDAKNYAEALDQFIWFTDSYRGSGQTLGRNGKKYYNNGVLADIVHCHEADSLDQKYNSFYVNLRQGLLQKLCENEIQFKQLGTLEGNPVCTCEKPDFHLLITDYVAVHSPVKCGTCFEVIPLYKLPPTNEYDHSDVMRWETNYQACDDLQMNCEVGEQWALDQMGDSASELSQKGREICSKIEEQTSIPTYYYLHNYKELSVEDQIDLLCPSCNGEWLLMQPLADGMFNYKCDTCKLISSFSPNTPD